MPNDYQAQLYVRPGQIPDWNHVMSNAGWYSFIYQGGTNNRGGMEVRVGNGVQTLHVDLDDENRRYSINNVLLVDPTNQLTYNSSPTHLNIIDRNDQGDDAHYTIVVQDSGNNNVLVRCDPMIKNDPPPTSDMAARPAQAAWRRLMS